MTRILVVDNYDSFVYTIVGYLAQLGADSVVARNDVVASADVAQYDGVLVSPGPGLPQDAGASTAVIEECARLGRPMLGVCLGHQALGVVYGATIGRAPELLHGKTSQVVHDGHGILDGLPSPFVATRYHSLAVDEATVRSPLLIDGRTPSGIVMALSHESLPLYGVQFHPESVLTEGGHRLLANWLGRCGLSGAVDAAVGLGPLVRADLP